MSDSNSVYQAPSAKLYEQNGEMGDFTNFKRISAWLVFFYSVITLGIYSLFWFYSRMQAANLVADKKVEEWKFYGYLITFLLSFFGGSILAFVMPESLFGSLLSLFNFIFYIIFIYSFRAALLSIINKNNSLIIKVGPILTFFFSSIYFQYKINEAIDQKATK
jgi:hypothetical protein